MVILHPRCLENSSTLPTIIFQGRTVSWRECSQFFLLFDLSSTTVSGDLLNFGGGSPQISQIMSEQVWMIFHKLMSLIPYVVCFACFLLLLFLIVVVSSYCCCSCSSCCTSLLFQPPPPPLPTFSRTCPSNGGRSSAHANDSSLRWYIPRRTSRPAPMA